MAVAFFLVLAGFVTFFLGLAGVHGVLWPGIGVFAIGVLASAAVGMHKHGHHVR